MERTVKGFLMVGMVDLVKKELPENGAKLLEQEFGAPINFSMLHDYPYSVAAKLRDSAIKILYGKVDDQGYEKMGEQVWCLIGESAFGKTLMHLFGTNFKEMAQQTPRFYEILAPGGQTKFIDLGPTSYRMRHVDDLSPAPFYVGIHKAAARQFGLKPKFKITNVAPTTYEITVAW